VEKSIYGLAIKNQTCPEHTCGEPAESSRGISRLRFTALEMTRISALIIHNQYNPRMKKLGVSLCVEKRRAAHRQRLDKNRTNQYKQKAIATTTPPI